MRRMFFVTKKIAPWAVAALSLMPFSVPPAVAAQRVTLLETGSTLLYPLFNLWVPGYTRAHPGVRITTQGTGSGTGIAQAISGVAQIGASDAYMSNLQIKQNPSIANIPLAISAQTVNYNVPGLNRVHLKFSGPVLAGIYDGRIRYWNDRAIQSLNPGVRLPRKVIVPIHRTDGSGDTFIFSQYLSFSTPQWDQNVGYGTTISWPALPGSIGAVGNPGMVQAAQQNRYSIAYIGVSFSREVAKAGLGTAFLKNRAGRFLLPTPVTIGAAANQLVAKTPKDERLSLVFAPGVNSYPIINYEYAIVNKHQPNRAVGDAVRNFLRWAVDPRGGNSMRYLSQVHFMPLPGRISQLSKVQINEIK